MFDYKVIDKIRCSEHYIPRSILEEMIAEQLDLRVDRSRRHAAW